MERAVNNAASAKGLLRTGGTLKALMDYRGGLASQEFGNIENRRLGTWQQNRANQADIYDRDVRNRLTKYGLDYQGESDKFARALATNDTQYGQAAGGFGLNNNAMNQQIRNLMSLYGIYTAGLPTYTPTAVNPF
jgi:hypothetical protein